MRRGILLAVVAAAAVLAVGVGVISTAITSRGHQTIRSTSGTAATLIPAPPTDPPTLAPTPTPVPVSTQATIPSQYVRHWVASSAYLEIHGDGSGLEWANWAQCPGDSRRVCALVANIAVAPSADSLSVTVVSSTVNVEDGNPGTPTSTAVPDDFPRKGDAFFLKLGPDGKLRQDTAHTWRSSPSVWCTPEFVTSTGECGA